MKSKEDMTDEELALSYIDGDNQAFDVLLERNKGRLFSYILFVVRDKDVANDVFQETFMKVIQRLQEGRYVASGKFSSWIMRIAHNVIMDTYRSHRVDRIVDAANDNDLSNLKSPQLSENSVESSYVYSQVMEDVKRIMDHLPAPQREVVFMRYYQELSFKEIAEMTGVSINTSLGRMRYAILNMRRLAREHGVQLNLV